MQKKFDKSIKLFEEAKKVIPGGVNSPVRAFQSVDNTPLFIESGLGSKITDADGNEYIDYVLSWGPLILGHRHKKVVEALEYCLTKGTGYGTPTEVETELSKEIIDAVPSVEMIRMVNSGTEATMSALRLARAYTKRDKILKFEGCYHGHSDPLLVKAGSGALTFGVPSSPGVPKSISENTLTARYNDLESVEKIFAEYGEDIASIIIEPVAGNMGTVPPLPGFLEGIREITTKYSSLLIFDEVMTGFRVAFGGAQNHFAIEPDLTCFGKVIGGGLPVGAYGGKKEIMENISPAGPVYQAGTLSGNPLTMYAGLATIRELKKPGVYEQLTKSTEKLVAGLKKNAEKIGIPVCINQIGAMFGLFFTDQEVIDYETSTASDSEKFKKYFNSMLMQGIYLAPSPFEATFLSLAHSDEDLEKTIAASEIAFKEALKA